MNQLLTVFIFLLLTATAFANGGVKGTITFDGQVPKFAKIRMDADPICLTHHQDAVYPDSLVVNETKGLANVIVRILNAPTSSVPIPTDPVVIDQQGCNYSPHVSLVRVGQKVKILNPDGTLHNVHSLSKSNKEFNVAMPNFRTEYETVFTSVEQPFQLKCDVHPWMLAWITVTDNPYVALTDNNGQFIINDLPAGSYTVEFWQERLGTKQVTVNIIDNQVTTIDTSLSKPQ